MAKSETILLRLSPDEKMGFEQAAELSGISTSAWIRERLRLASIRDLESAGIKAPFIAGIGEKNE